MSGRKLSTSEKVEMLNFKVEASISSRFKEIVGKEGLTVSEALRKVVERYVEIKGRMVK